MTLSFSATPSWRSLVSWTKWATKVALKMAGIVTAHQSRMSKNGKAFGIFNLEDFTGTFEFALFGDDYAKFKGYLDAEFYVVYHS